MEKTNKKECTNPKCKSSNLDLISKIEPIGTEVDEAVIKLNQQDTGLAYYYKCNDCGEKFEYQPNLAIEEK